MSSDILSQMTAQAVREIQDYEDAQVIRILKQSVCPACHLYVHEDDGRAVDTYGQHSHTSPHDCEVAGVRDVIEM